MFVMENFSIEEISCDVIALTQQCRFKLCTRQCNNVAEDAAINVIVIVIE